MKRSVLLISLIGSSAAFSAAEPNLNMGFVNFQTAFMEEHEAQKLTKELENDERLIVEGEQKARADIEAKMANFQNSMAKLSEKSRQDQQTALSNEINTLQQQFTQKRVELNQKREHLTAELEKRNRLVLDSILKRKKLDAIYNSVALVAVSDEYKKKDITGELVAEYNKLFPVKAEAPKKETSKKPSPKK